MFMAFRNRPYRTYSTYIFYSNEILNAAAVAQGENNSDTMANAPSNDRCADGLVPITLASTAPAPKISAGM